MGRALSAVFAGFLGIIVIYAGIWIAGYLNAIAIPKAYFDWFSDKNLPALAFWLLDIPTQFFSFGLPALFAGIIISRLLKGEWRQNTYAAITAFLASSMAFNWSYFSADTVWLPVIGAHFILPPICLYLAARSCRKQAL